MTPQWRFELRKDSDGTMTAHFNFDGERGHIQMEASAGDLDLRNLDAAQVDELRGRYGESCIISWHEDVGPDRAVEVRVSAGRILVSKLNGVLLVLGDRVEGGVGDQDGEWLISYVRSLV